LGHAGLELSKHRGIGEKILPLVTPFSRCVTPGGIKVDKGTIVHTVPNVLFGERTSRVVGSATNPERIMVDGMRFKTRPVKRGGIPTNATHQIGDSDHAAFSQLIGLVCGRQG
jgi:hypothetical protein